MSVSAEPDRTVLVTGCSSGIGLATAVELAADGWRVFATMRDPARRGRLDDAADRRGVADRVEVVRLDVTDDTTIRSAFDDVLARSGGRLDALVNNAGIADAGFFEDLTDDEFRHVMETNFHGAVDVTRQALGPMHRAGAGHIVMVSSVAAFFVNPGVSAYVASKWALEGWAEALAIELRPMGIRVHLVEPGTIATDIWGSRTKRVGGSPYGPWAEAMEPRVQRLAKRFGRDPAVVGKRIARLLDRPSPWLRHPVGFDARMLRMASVLPTPARRAMSALATGRPRVGR